MNLHAKLQQRAAQGKPLRVGLIGAGKFGAMYLAQVPKIAGVHLVAIADLAPANARANLERVGWKPERCNAASFEDALAKGNTYVGDDWEKLVAHPGIDIVIECTGHPPAAVEHCLAAFRHGKHVVNVTVEADAFCGPLLARKAAEAGVIYSLAYGDQPALICDLVDWARASGFSVVAAGRGHKWLPHFAQSTPDTVWGYYGLTPEQARVGGLNPKMFNSFLDGSKPAIESAAVCNATGLLAPPGGLTFPPASVDDIPFVCRPISEGGVLHQKGQVEVVSSLERDGRIIPYDIRFGVFVVFEGETDYIRNCFKEYMVRTDPSGRYACLYKRWHLIGLEAGISVASVGLRAESTGCADRIPRRCGGDREAQPESGRDAGRRRRLHRRRQALSRRRFAGARRAAAGPGAQREAAQSDRRECAGALERRASRRFRHCGEVSARDGARFRAATPGCRVATDPPISHGRDAALISHRPE